MRNYNRGVEVERKAMKELEVEGFSCFRTAGSHGVFDVFAFRGDKTLLIQLKRTKKFRESYYKSALEKIKVWSEELVGNTPELKYPVCWAFLETWLWVWVDNSGWVKKRIFFEESEKKMKKRLF